MTFKCLKMKVNSISIGINLVISSFLSILFNKNNLNIISKNFIIKIDPIQNINVKEL